MSNDHQIKKIDMGSAGYPEQLYNIPNPPKTLFCIGNEALLKKRSIAVVGSRKCSEYGKQTAMKIGKATADYGVVLVSGLAKGIDTFGHIGSLRNGGETIAVLGCGPDICYPNENRKIYEEIAGTGLIVSEYPPGTRARSFTFPQRNRIISGLSEGVVVVEAGTNSGALITAVRAAEQGREVFAVPGNISSRYSLGSNKLLADGAVAVAVIDDIFTNLGMDVILSDEETEALSDEEKRVFEYVKNNGEVSIDEVALALGESVIRINGLVSVLELKGFIAYSLGKLFVAKF